MGKSKKNKGKSNKNKSKNSEPIDLKAISQVIAGIARDPFTAVFQGLLKSTDATLLAKGKSDGLKVYDQIEQDCHAYSTLQKRKLAVVSCEWEIVAATDDAADKKAADGIRDICKALDMDGLTFGLLDAILKGYAVAEVIWNPETWLPDDLPIRNQRRFLFDADCKPRLLTPENKQTGEALPDRKFIIHQFGSKDGSPYGLGLGTRLFWPVFFKNHGISYWMAFAERFGGPSVVGKYPPEMTKEKQDELLDTLSRLNQERAIVVPLEAEVELIEAAKTGSIDTYERLSRYMDEEISKAVLGETLTTSVGETGSYAASQTHNGVRMELVKADADMLSNTLNKTLMTWLCEFHFPGANPPRFWRRVEEPSDTKAEAEKDALVATLGFAPEEDYIQEKYGAGWVKRAPEFGGGDDLGADAEPEAETPATPTAEPAPAAQTTVQDTALNGAQFTSLLQILGEVATGIHSRTTAFHVIKAGFPGVSEEHINGMLDGIKVREPEPAPAQKPAEKPAEFAEADETDKISSLADQAEAATAEAMGRLLEPIRRLVMSAKNLEEIRDGILECYPDIDSASLSSILSDAFTVASLMGADNVRRG